MKFGFTSEQFRQATEQLASVTGFITRQRLVKYDICGKRIHMKATDKVPVHSNGYGRCSCIPHTLSGDFPYQAGTRTESG